MRALLKTCAADTAGKRDAVVLGLLLGAGLRRSEAVALTFAAVKVQPVAARMRTVLAVKGKGAKDRVVPISDSSRCCVARLGRAGRGWSNLSPAGQSNV